MPQVHLLRLWSILLLAGLLGGCANHLPQRNEHETRAERKLLVHRLEIDAGQPNTLDVPQRTVRIHDLRTYEVTEYEVVRRYDRYTPYQVWRELYEIPLGAVALAAGVGANIVNFFTLGSLPDNVTQGWLSYGIDGLNPFMNIESNGRADQSLASIEENQKDKRIESTHLPWSESPVTLRLGQESFELQTDADGILSLNLLETPFSDVQGKAFMQMSVRDFRDGSHAQASLRLASTLRQQLQESYALIYGDIESEDVNEWVYRLHRLKSMGLEKDASELKAHLIELSRNDAQLHEQLLKALTQSSL